MRESGRFRSTNLANSRLSFSATCRLAFASPRLAFHAATSKAPLNKSGACVKLLFSAVSDL